MSCLHCRRHRWNLPEMRRPGTWMQLHAEQDHGRCPTPDVPRRAPANDNTANTGKLVRHPLHSMEKGVRVDVIASEVGCFTFGLVCVAFGYGWLTRLELPLLRLKLASGRAVTHA